MNHRIQFSVRLERELNEKFQAKLQSEGWNKNSLITKLIQSFVESDELPPALVERAGDSPPAILASLRQEIQAMNRQILALQSLLFQVLSQSESDSI